MARCVDHGNVVVVVFVPKMRRAAAVSFADEENARQDDANGSKFCGFVLHKDEIIVQKKAHRSEIGARCLKPMAKSTFRQRINSVSGCGVTSRTPIPTQS